MHAHGSLALEMLATEPRARALARVRPFFPRATAAALSRMVEAFRKDVAEPLLAHRRVDSMERELSVRLSVAASIVRVLDDLVAGLPASALADARRDSIRRLHGAYSDRAREFGPREAEFWEEAIQGYRAAIDVVERTLAKMPERPPIQVLASYLTVAAPLENAAIFLWLATMGLGGSVRVGSRATLRALLRHAMRESMSAYRAAREFATSMTSLAAHDAEDPVRDVSVSARTLALWRISDAAWARALAA